MKIVVCVKQVGVLGDEVGFTADGRDVDPDYLDQALNEWDACATEEALRIRERLGRGEVVAATCAALRPARAGGGVTAGASAPEVALRRCLAMGVDRAVRVDADALDPISLAQALADAVRRESPDLVLCGVQSSDSVQGSTGTALAELLGLPRVAVVTRIEWGGSGPATVHRELEGGLIDIVEVDTPALLTVQTGINQPRYATLRAIKQAEQKEIAVVAAGNSAEPAYRVRRMFAPPKGEGAQMLQGGPAEIARQIADIVRERLK
jgi:electron transfer flavoprotein beta subunit